MIKIKYKQKKFTWQADANKIRSCFVHYTLTSFIAYAIIIFLFSPDACPYHIFLLKINIIIKNNVNTSRCDDNKKLLL